MNQTITYVINVDGVEIGQYCLTEMAGCPRVVISHGLRIDEPYRNRGNGSRAMEDRINNAKMMGYEVMLATVVDGNVPEEKILRRYGWKEVTVFDNQRTGNTVKLWQLNLNDPYKDWIGGCR